MLPVVAKVVRIGEGGPHAWQYRVKTCPFRVDQFQFAIAVRVRRPVRFAADPKQVKMLVLPAHDNL
jgi:hypothetical protein